MVKRTSHKSARCPIARTLDAIGDGWSLLIVRNAFDGLRRFGEFQRSLGLAKNILSARLKNLVEHGIFHLVPTSDGYQHYEYLLTEKGVALYPILVAIHKWGANFFFAPGEAHARLVNKSHKRPQIRLAAAGSTAISKRDARVSGGVGLKSYFS
jgi:DNA-binding HxlR family transcriptional regulator